MSWLSDIFKKKERVQTFCVPNSILCAWTWGVKKGDKVRIAITHIEPGLDHSQAEALIYGKWTPLTEIWSGSAMEIQPYKRHYDIAPYRYATLKDWIDENYKYVNQEEL